MTRPICEVCGREEFLPAAHESGCLALYFGEQHDPSTILAALRAVRADLARARPLLEAARAYREAVGACRGRDGAWDSAITHDAGKLTAADAALRALCEAAEGLGDG